MKKPHIARVTRSCLGMGLLLMVAGCSSESEGNEVPAFRGGTTDANGMPVTPGSAPNGTVPGASGAVPGVSGSATGAMEGSPNVGTLTDPAAPGAGTPGATAPVNGAGGMAAALPVPGNLGDLPAARDLSCDGITVLAADVISDFNTAQAISYPVGIRGGTLWESYADGLASNPATPGNAFQVDPTQSGPCNSGGSLHVSSPGNTGYGVGFGVNFRADVTPGITELYDARADGYTGVAFWSQCQQEVQFTFLKVSDDATEATVQNPQCTDATCRQYGIKNSVLLAGQWERHEIYFDEALLDDAATVPGTGLHSNALTGFQIQFNTRAGSQPNGFDCLIDDVHFLRTPTPRATPPGNVTNANGNAIAPGGYYTQGNQIFDASGNVHIFKGFARPSFEFDAAGQGITREDIQRMRAKGANVVRYALSQGFWLSTHPEFDPNYQAYIDRAVQWTLQAGMDVIIDLHWSGTPADQQKMADQDSIVFWQQVARKYGNDGRVMFELYNEPNNDGSKMGGQLTPQVWRNGGNGFVGMQQMYDAVRAAAANNLILVGGIDFAYDLDSLLPALALTGNNIAYVTHPYRFKSPPPPQGYDTASLTFPIIATEFGDAAAGGIGRDNCDTATYAASIDDFTRRGISWTAWAWVVAPERCAFPALLESYDGTPTPPGQLVFDRMRN